MIRHSTEPKLNFFKSHLDLIEYISYLYNIWPFISKVLVLTLGLVVNYGPPTRYRYMASIMIISSPHMIKIYRTPVYTTLAY